MPLSGDAGFPQRNQQVIIVVDLAFLIEAQNGDELPERLLGCARLSHIELDDALIPAYA